jgi:hypothetical protein
MRRPPYVPGGLPVITAPARVTRDPVAHFEDEALIAECRRADAILGRWSLGISTAFLAWMAWNILPVVFA